MKRFVRSGELFLVVAVLCAGAGIAGEHRSVFISSAAVWLILGMAIRRKYMDTPPE